jgi:hypothetical protein
MYDNLKKLVNCNVSLPDAAISYANLHKLAAPMMPNIETTASPMLTTSTMQPVIPHGRQLPTFNTQSVIPPSGDLTDFYNNVGLNTVGDRVNKVQTARAAAATRHANARNIEQARAQQQRAQMAAPAQPQAGGRGAGAVPGPPQTPQEAVTANAYRRGQERRDRMGKGNTPQAERAARQARLEAKRTQQGGMRPQPRWTWWPNRGQGWAGARRVI